jgi:glucokinase
VGGTHLRTAVVDAAGAVHARRHGRTPTASGGPAIVDASAAALRATLEAWLTGGGARPTGLGISAPGPLDPRTGVTIDPPNLGDSFHGLSLGPPLGAALDLPWAVEKDTNVAVLGETWVGAAAGFRDVVYITVSTGVGGGVLSDGRLITGPDRSAGELGHLVADMDGPICGCGGRGHLEGISSGSGMARSARTALETGADAPGLAAVAARIAPAPLEAVHVSEAAEAGDAVAQGIIDRARRAFAACVVSIVDMFGPDRIVVGGGIAIAWGDALLQPARDLVARTAFRVQAARVRIVPAALGDDAGLIGSLPLVRSALSGAPAAGDAPLDPSAMASRTGLA